MGLYREIKANISFPQKWKDITVNIGASASTLQDIKVADSSGGYSYLQSADALSCTRNRYIYWRTSNDVLELVEESLDANLTGSHVRYRFQDTPILGGVSIHESHGEIIVLVPTVASVHRLVFPHPNRINKGHGWSTSSSSAHMHSVFHDASLTSAADASNFHVLNPTGAMTTQLHDAASYLTYDEEAMFTYATHSGSILVVTMPSSEVKGIVQQLELSQSSVMQKLWQGIVPVAMRGGQEAEDAVQSMVIFPAAGDTYIISVCRDHKARMWSTKKQECVIVCNLLDYTPEQRSSQSVGTGGHTVKSIVNPTSSSYQLCVHLNFHYHNQFILLEPMCIDGRFEMRHLSTIRGPPEDLADFCCTEEHLWSLWTNSAGDSVARVANVSRSHKMKEVLLESVESSDHYIPPNHDPRDFYLKKIFHPGRFSLQEISKALNVYTRSMDNTFLTETNLHLDALREAVSRAVEDEISDLAAAQEVDEDDYYNLLTTQWNQFYSCCNQYQQVNSKLKGLFADNCTGLVGLIKKGCVSFLRPCDVVEGHYLQPTFEMDILDSDIELEEDLMLKRDIQKIFSSLHMIRTEISDDLAAQIKFLLLHEEDPQEALNHFTEEILFCPSSDMLTPGAESICHCLQETKDVQAAIEKVIEILDLTRNVEEENLMEDSTAMDANLLISCQRLFSSQTGSKLLSECVAQFSASRLSASRDLLLLLMAILKMADQSGVSLEVLEMTKNVFIPQMSAIIRCYLVLDHISDTVALPYQHNSIEFNTRQLSTLAISESCAITSPRPVFTQNCAMLELFIDGVGGTNAREHLARLQSVNPDRGTIWTSSLHSIITSIANSLWPNSDRFIYPEFLVSCCQYLQVQKYVHLLRDWCEWNVASRKFLLGVAYLHFDEPTKAAQCFVNAQEGIHNEKFLYSHLLQTEDRPGEMFEVYYYLKVIKQFEEFNYAEIVIDLANIAKNLADPKDPNLATLWSKIFKYHLELGHSNEAYSAMVSNPDPTRRKDCLRQLLITLCERGDLQTLVNFPYTDLEEEVVLIVESRARSVDLSTHNYYDLLYSFYIMRNNFRKAGSVMYEHGSRLGRELPSERGLRRQAQCYLAAMNAIRIINQDYAWIVKPVEKAGKEIKSNKHSFEGFTKDKGYTKKCEILTLEDIEKEYMLVDARLRLIRTEADSGLSAGPTPSPDEMIGLLVNAGLYDRGVLLSRAFNLSLNPVFESLSLRCINLSKNVSHYMRTDTDYTSHTWDWLKENNMIMSSNAFNNSCADQAWFLLQTYLEKFEDDSGSYHKVTAMKLLTHGFSLPTWFVISYKGVSASALLRLYVDYDLLKEAGAMVIEYIDTNIDVLRGQDSKLYKLKGSLRKSPQQVWLPYNCIDQLLIALRDHRDNVIFGKICDQLEDKLAYYFGKIEDLSEDVSTIMYH